MDERSIQAIQLPGCTVEPLVLKEILPETQLKSYIEGLQIQIRHKRPVLIGGCYGGPLAIEISKIIDVEKLILVACVKDKEELTAQWRILFRFYLLIPTKVQIILGVSSAFILNRILRLPIKIPRVWKKSAQNKFMAEHLLKLKLNTSISKVIHIHGLRDSVFPIRKIKNVSTVIDGSHFLLDKNRKETLKAMTDAVFEK